MKKFLIFPTLLDTLTLSGFELKSEAGYLLSKVLEISSTLKNFCIDVPTKTMELILLGDSLSRNSTLKSFPLSGANLGDHGLFYFWNALFPKNSLCSLKALQLIHCSAGKHTRKLITYHLAKGKYFGSINMFCLTDYFYFPEELKNLEVAVKKTPVAKFLSITVDEDILDRKVVSFYYDRDSETFYSGLDYCTEDIGL